MSMMLLLLPQFVGIVTGWTAAFCRLGNAVECFDRRSAQSGYLSDKCLALGKPAEHRGEGMDMAVPLPVG